MSEETSTLPLFPLHTVLFPGGPLPLRILEPRYVDLVKRCIKDGSGFGVCLIASGNEVGSGARTHELGTLARIVDWHMRYDGLLGITTCGERRFRIVSQHVQRDQLHMAEVEWLPDEPACDVPPEYLLLVDRLHEMVQHVHHYAAVPQRFGDATWVGYRLAELLPISLLQKQRLLHMDNAVLRLQKLCSLMEGLALR